MMRSKMGGPAKSVDDYIKRYPPKVQKALQDIRRTIASTAPNAEERISYGMPAYKYHGWLVYFGGFKGHCSFFVASLAMMKKLERDLEPYNHSGATIHFTPEDPLPASLVKKIVEMRMKENVLKEKARGRTARVPPRKRL